MFLALLLWGMTMVVLNGTAWCYELMPMVRHFKRMDKPKLSNGYNIPAAVLGLCKSWMFVIDLGITTVLTNLFGFGGGLIGGIIGLTISNVFSVFILTNNVKTLKG